MHACRPLSHPYPHQRQRRNAALLAVSLCAPLVMASQASLASAQTPPSPADVTDSRPYDDKLMRLSEILGAVHYLRELCGGNEGQAWRDRMRELIDADKGSALRRVKLTKSFNHGYRSFRRTFQVCSPTAQATLAKFLQEGAELSDLLLRDTQ